MSTASCWLAGGGFQQQPCILCACVNAAGCSPQGPLTARHLSLAPAVCTLADLSYDIYHATIDSSPQEGTAQQEYYVR